MAMLVPDSCATASVDTPPLMKSLTRQGSQVRTLYRPPSIQRAAKPASRGYGIRNENAQRARHVVFRLHENLRATPLP